MTLALALLSLILLVAALALAWNLRGQKKETQYLQQTLWEKTAMAVRAEAERDAVKNELERYRLDEQKRFELARIEIEALSNRIFEEKTLKFNELGKATMNDVVGPVKQELERLKKTLEESDKTDAVRENDFKHALAQVLELNKRLGDQAEGLAKALKGDNKLVGDYGEDLLERILEFSGLRKGEHFLLQGEGLGLKADDGGHLKPDVLILLPENRCLVVDAKMSLLSWANAQTQEEPGRSQSLEAFRQSIRSHINNLASKPYTESLSKVSLTSIDFKFLFIPIEAAFHASLLLDSDLYKYAFDKRIILTSPTTLLATLTTVNHTWRQYDIGRNALEISDRASKLMDKLTDFLSSMEDIGKHLDRARDAYAQAHTRLASGSGNLVGQAEKLKDLGVKARKQMPKSFQIQGADVLDAEGGGM